MNVLVHIISIKHDSDVTFVLTYKTLIAGTLIRQKLMVAWVNMCLSAEETSEAWT